MRKLVSVLIPAYNAERWIADTIQSVTTQTWADKELIIVDDGSTDQTLSLARSFESARVKVVTQANAGASAARNKGLSLAQGDYIQWLDADDLIAPDKIGKQMHLVEDGESNTTLLSSSFGEFLARPESAEFRPTALWQNLTPVDYMLHRFIKNLWMSPAVWLVSRDLIERAGRWDERLSLDDDGEYFSRLVSKSSGVRFVPQARSYYRRGNVKSLSRSVSETAYESLLLSLQLCIGHLRSIEDSARTRAACICLLQNWVDHSDVFYPDAAGRFRRACEVARALGGDLTPPKISWKYAPIHGLFGWNAVRQTRATWSNLKLQARLQIDRLSPINSEK